MSADLAPWSSVRSPARRTDNHGIGRSLLQVEAQCTLYLMEGYYWAVDVAPILLRYQAQQWWRDAKQTIGYLAADLMEALDEWIG